MAASDVEVVRLKLSRIASDSTPYQADTGGRTIRENLEWGDDELRVIPDSDVPESSGSPTIKEYLKAMAGRASPHVPVLINQTMIVTRTK